MVSNQEISSVASENLRGILMPCYAWECLPIAISNDMDILEVSGYHLLEQMSSQWGSQKLP